MSEKQSKDLDAVSETEAPVEVILPQGFIPNNSTYFNEPWFSVWVPQTFAGTVSGGYAQPTLSGTGWYGTNNNGFVYQTDQYNTTNRGF